eukprot:13517274-Ditylum_brightwellii.AAC.1
MPSTNKFVREACFLHPRNFAQPAQLPAVHNVIYWVYFEFLTEELIRQAAHLYLHPTDVEDMTDGQGVKDL